MVTNRQYVLPATFALLLHVLLFAALVFGVSFRSEQPITPLAIQATLVMEDQVIAAIEPPEEVVEDEPPAIVEELPEPEPEEEVQEPEVDLEAIAREKAAELQRLEDARREQARLAEEEAEVERERLAEEQRQRDAEAERERIRLEEERIQREEAERRKREEEARIERERIAEQRRQEEIQRQREENERKRQEAIAAARQAEIDAEERRIAAVNSGAMQAYVFAIQQKVYRNWVSPPSARPGLDCTVAVRQSQGGDVLSVNVTRCNGDAAVERSIIAAVQKASPLPLPSTPSLFDRNLTIIFKPEQ